MDKKDKELQFILDRAKLLQSDIKSPDYTSPLDQDVMKVKGGRAAPEPSIRIPGATEHINTKQATKLLSGSDHADKISRLLALKALGKKAAGVIPFAGAGMAALSGDPAMAADELAGDIPVVGQAYEAIKPTDTGNVDEEMEMLAEDEARKNYAQSPAGQGAKLARLKAMMGSK